MLLRLSALCGLHAAADLRVRAAAQHAVQRGLRSRARRLPFHQRQRVRRCRASKPRRLVCCVSYVRTSPHTQACILSFAGKQRPSHTGARASHICAGTRLSVSGSSGFSRGKWDGSATECALLIALAISQLVQMSHRTVLRQSAACSKAKQSKAVISRATRLGGHTGLCRRDWRCSCVRTSSSMTRGVGSYSLPHT